MKSMVCLSFAALIVAGLAVRTPAAPPPPSNRPPAMVAEHGWTPLHWAARIGDLEQITAALRAGGDLEARDRLQRTPLHLAVLGVQPDAVRLLLASGAAVNARDTWGTTPLRRALLLEQVRGWDMRAVLSLLRDAGAQK